MAYFYIGLFFLADPSSSPHIRTQSERAQELLIDTTAVVPSSPHQQYRLKAQSIIEALAKFFLGNILIEFNQQMKYFILSLSLLIQVR